MSSPAPACLVVQELSNLLRRAKSVSPSRPGWPWAEMYIWVAGEPRHFSRQASAYGSVDASVRLAIYGMVALFWVAIPQPAPGSNLHPLRL